MKKAGNSHTSRLVCAAKFEGANGNLLGFEILTMPQGTLASGSSLSALSVVPLWCNSERCVPHFRTHL